MSVSLCVLRLEVSDNCSTAPGIDERLQNLHDLPEMEAPEVNNENLPPETSPTQVGKIEIKAHGRRGYQRISVETVPITASDFSSRSGSGGAKKKRLPRTHSLPPSPRPLECGVALPRLASVDSRAVSSLEHLGPPELENSSLSNRRRDPIDGNSRHPCAGKDSISLHYTSGNPFVEVTEGVLHLYKQNNPTSLSDEAAPSRPPLLCILAVPSTLTSHDLLNFIAPCFPGIQHVRIIRNETPNQYMVLLKFKNQRLADDFFKSYNGIPFTSFGSEICHLVYISRVETVKQSEGGCLPLEGHTELPTCPVCLERMDESVDGILTILCNHSFHGNCLYKWGDSSCPVCRHTSTPELQEDHECLVCASKEQDLLWICLICGHLGCGRYQGGHAHSHFLETNHTFAMQVGTHRVWDYVGDNFVHRLAQNKGDGKLVEVTGGGGAANAGVTVEGVGGVGRGGGRGGACFEGDSDDGGEKGVALDSQDKVDSIQLEYLYTWTYQLDEQRRCFQEKMLIMDAEHRKVVTDMRLKTEQLSLENQLLQSLVSEKEKGSWEKKASERQVRLEAALKSLSEERDLNSCLRENQSILLIKNRDLEKKLDEKEKEILEYKEQVRDLMFFMEAQSELSRTSGDLRADIQGGTVHVAPPDPGAGRGAAGRGRSRRGRR